jgi:hypothetical protein
MVRRKMTKKELHQLLCDLGACETARDHVLRSKKGPQWLWENARFHWRIWLRDRLHHYNTLRNHNRQFAQIYNAHRRANKALSDKFYTAADKIRYYDDLNGQKYARLSDKYKLEERRLFERTFTWKVIEEALWKTQE